MEEIEIKKADHIKEIVINFINPLRNQILVDGEELKGIKEFNLHIEVNKIPIIEIKRQIINL